MKINKSGPIQSSSAGAPKRTSNVSDPNAPSFSSLLDSVSNAEGAAPVASVGGINAVGALIGFQEVSDDEIRRKKELRRGDDMLDSLERLRASLLSGAVPHDVLGELANRLALQRQQINDPRLMDVMDDIELRVAVELAKLEMAAKRQDESLI